MLLNPRFCPYCLHHVTVVWQQPAGGPTDDGTPVLEAHPAGDGTECRGSRLPVAILSTIPRME